MPANTMGILLLLLVSLPAMFASQVSIVVLWEEPTLTAAPVLPSPRAVNQTTATGSAGVVTINFRALDLTGLSTLHVYKSLCDAVSSGAVVFISLLQCPGLHLVSSTLQELQMPLIALGDPCALPNPRGSFVWQYPVREPSQGGPLPDIINSLAWKDVLVIHEKETAGALDATLTALTANNATVQILRVEGSADVAALLLSLARKQEKNFIVHTSRNTSIDVLQQANGYAAKHGTHATYQYGANWLFLGDADDVTALASHVGELDNVAVVIPTENQHQATLQTLLQEALNMSIQAVEETLLVNTSHAAGDNASVSCALRQSVTDTVAVMLDSLLTMAPCANCSEYVVMSAMWLPGREREFQATASWGHYGLALTPGVFPNLRFGLNGRHLKVLTLSWEPFVKSINGSTTHYEGFVIKILEEVATNLNFSFHMDAPADGLWGGQDENGTWNGLVGSLVRKEADMVAAPISVTLERSRVVDYTDHFYLEYNAVLVKYDDPESKKWRLYFEPYTWEVWVLLGSMLPLGTLITWLFSKFSYYYSPKQRKDGLAKVDNSAIFIVGSCFQQGSIHQPLAQSGRFFVGFWWMYVMVVVATYSGNLIAFLTVSRSSLPFDTLEEMVRAGTHKYGTIAATQVDGVLKHASAGVFKTMYENIKEWEATEDPDVHSTDLSVHLEKVKTENYAYIGDKTSFEMVMVQHCTLNIIKETFAPSKYAFALQQDSAFYNVVSDAVRTVKESGVLNRWKVQFWPRPTFCPGRESVTEAKSVSIVDVQGAYYTLAILLTLAFLALFAEHMIHLLNSANMKVTEKCEQKAVEEAAPKDTLDFQKNSTVANRRSSFASVRDTANETEHNRKLTFASVRDTPNEIERNRKLTFASVRDTAETEQNRKLTFASVRDTPNETDQNRKLTSVSVRDAPSETEMNRRLTFASVRETTANMVPVYWTPH